MIGFQYISVRILLISGVLFSGLPGLAFSSSSQVALSFLRGKGPEQKMY